MGLFSTKSCYLKNVPATFQQMIISDLEHCQGYIDDVIVYSESWEQHLSRVRSLLNRLKATKLTVNPLKVSLVMHM